MPSHVLPTGPDAWRPGCVSNLRQAPSLTRRYPVSSLPRTHPPGSRLRRTMPPQLVRLPCSAGFLHGARSPSLFHSHVLACVPSLSTPPSERTRAVVLRSPLLPFTEVVPAQRSGLSVIEAFYRAFTRRYGPRACSPRRARLCRWASPAGSPRTGAIQAMRLRPFTASGLSP